MLKIKDNVDLKELEKFGFKRQMFPIENGETFTTEYRRTYFNEPDVITSIDDETREICDWCDAFTYDRQIEKIMFDDLIKADLVEKVDSNER